MKQLSKFVVVASAAALTSLACSLELPSLPFGPDIGIGVPSQFEFGAEQDQTIEIPAVGSAANLRLQFAAGKLSLSGGGEELLTGSATTNVAKLKPVVEGSGGNWTVRTGDLQEFPGVAAGQLVNTWELVIGRDPLDLSLEIGAAEAKLDLGGVRLTRLELDSGAGDIHLTFSAPNPAAMDSFTLMAGAARIDLRQLGNANTPRMDLNVAGGDVMLDFAGDLKQDLMVSINGAAGNYTIDVPQEAAARFSRSGGFIAVNAGGGWTSSGDEYIHEGSGPEIQIALTAGAGNVNLGTK